MKVNFQVMNYNGRVYVDVDELLKFLKTYQDNLDQHSTDLDTIILLINRIKNF